MQIKPGLPRGVRDFSSETIYKRIFISEIISEVFKRYGFKPIETPAIENLNTLLGKYGNEGDRLIFKILNSGNYLSDLDTNSLNNIALKKLTAKISNKGLRYDLTIPFARYVVNHQNEIVFPFRRYQIQPVWRADRPQKGRFREFYQCDADVIGSNSLWNEVELLQIFDEVFQKLNIPTVLKINNRKILSGFIEEIGASKCNIAVSVHSPFEKERETIVPTQKQHKIKEIIRVIRNYPIESQRRISFEYILFDNYNDSINHADALIKLQLSDVQGVKIFLQRVECWQKFKKMIFNH